MTPTPPSSALGWPKALQGVMLSWNGSGFLEDLGLDARFVECVGFPAAPGVTPAVTGQCVCPQLPSSMFWALLGDFLIAQS